MSNERPKTSFVTFYSFKGGVGRSMALINTAGILAGRGFRVLVIDLDLEAPGLSYLNPDAPDTPAPRKTPEHSRHFGFVDLLSDAKERGEKSDLFALPPKEITKRYTRVYKLPDDLRDFPGGSVHIMPAGKFDSGYAQRFDALNLRELYQQGLGEPLVRAFKKKIAEAGLFDYVLVDSRTGFSDEAGICTRDLPDLLMILSGLNRQNVQGTTDFLKALRIATSGKAKFQVILSPVPNGEDALLDQREDAARKAFEEAWGSAIDLSLQIPYHPQLALTEEPHIFRRRHGYLFDAYRKIEQKMLEALGHDAGTLTKRIMEAFEKRDYEALLGDLHYLVRLDGGRYSASRLAHELVSSALKRLSRKEEGGLEQRTSKLDEMLNDKAGGRAIEIIIDQLPFDERDWGAAALLNWLTHHSVKLADRLHRRMVAAWPNNADALCNYAYFLENQRRDMDGAEALYKRAIEAEPNDAWNLGRYAVFLKKQRHDPDGAEALNKRAIEAEPKNASILASYAVFLNEQREDKVGAEGLFKRAIEAEPKNAFVLGSYAVVLEKQHGDMDGAEALFKRAIDAEPKNAHNLGNYAIFLAWQRMDKDGAETLFIRAIGADPRNARNLGNYADFLARQRGDSDGAERLFRQAIEMNPEDANHLGNYGQFLAGLGRQKAAKAALGSAMEHLDPSEIGTVAEFCFSLWLVSRMHGQDALSWERAFKFAIQHGFHRNPWDFDRMLEQAEKKLQPEEFEYAKALAAAFLDESKVPLLDQYERWRALEPLNPVAIAKDATSVMP